MNEGMDIRELLPFGPQDQVARFISKFQIAENGCWIWHAHINFQGYGHFTVNGEMCRSHRVSYQWLHGEVPTMLDHICNVTACCNPFHLRPTTNLENILRSSSPSAIHARKTTCPLGHAYTTVRYGNKTRDHRVCRECDRRRALIAGAKKRLNRALQYTEGAHA